MRENKLRKALKIEGPIFGMAVYTFSPTIVEIIGYSGFDFIFLDSEHTPLGVDATLEHIMRAADAAGIAVVLRIKGNDEHLIRNALEMGADGVVIPRMRTKADAEKAARCARYPPQGMRGASPDVRAAQYGAAADFNWEEYIRKVNEEIVVVGLAEDKEFFDNIDEILAVDGIDMINFGPTDLAMSLGLRLLYNMEAPPIQEAFEKLRTKAAARGISLMSPAAPPTLEQARKLADKGVKAIILRNDIVNFRAICRQYIDQVIRPIREKR
jgi:4-hydroxy-2-oxoheptanedioate aldolase